MKFDPRQSRTLLVVATAVLLAITILASPTPDSASATGVSAVAAGGAHSCALTAEGGVTCWGLNSRGQLGDGTTTNRATPVSVFDLTNAAALTAGGPAQQGHTCALTTGGGVKCWGQNSSGQLGDGRTVERTVPTDVVSLASDVTNVSAGSVHTCAVADAGQVLCWGSNWSGQLGDGSTTASSAPVQVVGLEGAVTVAAGLAHTCAVTSSGGVQCWGGNGSGQLGIPIFSDGETTPVEVCQVYDTSQGLCTEVLSGVVSLAVGSQHSCAVTTQGGVKCWGRNREGQLGDGTTSLTRRSPVDVVGLSSGVIAVAAGRSHTCALTDDGGVKCWGQNHLGQLGDGTTDNRTTPVDVTGLTDEVVGISVGSRHTCAVTAAGSVKCWGLNGSGELGGVSTDTCGTSQCSLTPLDVSGAKQAPTPVPTATPVSPTSTLTNTPVPATDTPTPGCPLLVGDANCNGEVTSIDALSVLQFGVGLFDPLPCPACADVNEDDSVSALDAALILQFVAGFLPALPP